MNTQFKTVDAVIVGAGFAGMYMLHRLRQLGLETLVIEKADGVGGTWYWNRYPGARCDIESMQYSYSFSNDLQQQWKWSERYATQPEILSYANHVVDRFDLRKNILFNSRVDSVIVKEDSTSTTPLWAISFVDDKDSAQVVISRFCIMATGCLSTPNDPKISGLENFHGEIYHTGRWPHEPVNFTDKCVALIGTGSSGIQATSVIAKQADHLNIFQRTPNYVVPANNRPFKAGEQEGIKSRYRELRSAAKLARNGVAQEIVTESAMSFSLEDRLRQYKRRWKQGGLTFTGTFGDLLLNAESNLTAAEFVRGKIQEIVDDPQTAALLSPKSTLGCKRLCVDSDYYSTFNRNNVSLIDVSQQGISRITDKGPMVNGIEYSVDIVVLATGFDAMTGTLNTIDIRGRNGTNLAGKWQAGPQTYLGLMINDFPNFFTITGPGSPSVLSNMLSSIEYHVNWISNCVKFMQTNHLNCIEATAEAEQGWANTVNNVVNQTLYQSCDSWYLGANITDKPRVFMPFPGVPPYLKICDQIAADGYTGFKLQS